MLTQSWNRVVTVAIDRPRSGILNDGIAEIPVRVAARQALELRGGRVRLVESVRVTNYYRVVVFYQKGNGLGGWPKSTRDVATAQIEGFTGRLEGGGARAGRAFIDATGAAPECHDYRVNVQHLLVAEIDLGSSGVATTRRHVIVLPGPSYWSGAVDATGRPLPIDRTPSTPGAAGLELVVDSQEADRPPHGVFMHDVTGHAYLRSPLVPLPTGRLELRLRRTATWEEHAPSLDRHGTVSETKDRSSLVLSTPALECSGSVELRFSVPTQKRRVAEQTTRTAEGSMVWQLVGRWSAGGHTAETSVEIVMAMPSLLTVSKG